MSWMFNKRCKHKFGKVETTGYQYCELCGFANFVPKKCEHFFKKESQKEIFHLYFGTKIVTGSIITDRCEKCGGIRITTQQLDNPVKFEFSDD